MFAVFEINGVPCARRAHFSGQVHDFQPLIIVYLLEGCTMTLPGAQFQNLSIRPVHKIKG